jgi:hypothetical protein
VDLKIEDEQITVLTGELIDQAQLHKLLNCLSDFGPKLLSFETLLEREGG